MFSILFLGGSLSITSNFFFVESYTAIDGQNYIALYQMCGCYFCNSFPLCIQCIVGFIMTTFFNCSFLAKILYWLSQPNIIWLLIKVFVMMWLFVGVRAIVPRYRYDQLMYLGWKNFLPLALFFLIFYFSLFLISLLLWTPEVYTSDFMLVFRTK